MFSIFDKLTEYIREIFIDMIKANLETLFVDLNDKVNLISQEVGKTPLGFNAEVFSFIKSINETVILPIAGLVITAILCIELIQTVTARNNLHDGDTFELFKYVFKMAIAVYLVSHAFEFSMAAFDLAQQMVANAAGVINISSNLDSAQLLSFVDALKEESLGNLLTIIVELSVIKLLIQGVSILIYVIVYGRMFEILVYTSVAPLPFATLANKEWGSIGTNYIKGLFAIALQGVFIMICLGIYSVLIKTIDMSNLTTATFMVLTHSILLGLMMLKSGTVAKSILNAH